MNSLPIASPSISVCDRASLNHFVWPNPVADAGNEAQSGRSFLTSWLETPSELLIRNVRTDPHLIRIGPHVFPATVNEQDYKNSWVCSPYNATISYPLDELREIRNAALRVSLAGLIHSVSPVLKAARINNVLCVNNWLLSTNLYPPWNGEGVVEATSELTQRWPEHAIMFRSLNPVSNAPLMKCLAEVGYILAPSRQVYLCEDLAAASRKQNSEIDRHFLERRTSYQVVRDSELSDEDVPRIRELYDQLYLQKYSKHNPQFTDQLILLLRKTGLLKMIGLRNEHGRLDGIVGCFGRYNVVTTPLIGYDLALPQKLGLYRMLTALVFQEARESGRILNLSAGAAQFKRHRGGEPCLEYSAVYVKHLPVFRRSVWKLLAGLLENVGAKILQKYQL